MATNKKLAGSGPVLCALMLTAMWLAGCGQSGPGALLKGSRLVEKGKYPEAIEQLTTATRLLVTNAPAWNYLGLAYHHAGQLDNAAEAYRKAYKYDRDLFEAHYNLGCLLLEQNKPADARVELTAFVLHEGGSLPGWLKLGTAQLRAHETAGAEKSFTEALHLDAENVEALNGLGLTELQRNRQREAAADFNRALAKKRDYAPAMLNLAVMAQSYANDPKLALQRYRAYLALNPRPPNWEAVNTLARQIDEDINQPARPLSVAQVASNPPATNVRPTNPAVRPAALAATASPRVEPVANTSRSVALVPAPAKPVVEPEPPARAEIVRVPETPAVKIADNSAPPARPTPPVSTPIAAPVETPAAAGNPGASDPQKRTFLQQINPANLFRRDTNPSPVPVSTNPSGMSQPPPDSASGLARYVYLAPAKPATGNRAEADRFFAQAAQAQRDRRSTDAVALYRSAAQADPSFFEAQANLALAAYNVQDWPQSLPAFEYALAIRPDSFGTRFNFALALQKAGYLQDAAGELERLIVGASSAEPAANLVAAHLTLARMYASQFHQPVAARPHFQKVLDLDPQNPDATSIRYWLRDHP